MAEKKGRKLGLEMPEVSSVSGAAKKRLKPSEVKKAGDDVGFGKNRSQGKSEVNKSAGANKRSAPKPDVQKKEPVAEVQYNARISYKLKEAILELQSMQEPKWPQAYTMKRMYLALCSELGVEPKEDL